MYPLGDRMRTEKDNRGREGEKEELNIACTANKSSYWYQCGESKRTRVLKSDSYCKKRTPSEDGCPKSLVIFNRSDFCSIHLCC